MAKPLRFSEHYGITFKPVDDWFDPLLNEDTKLYVDPFLIFLDTDPAWTNGHSQLMEFFNAVLKLLADAGFKEGSPKFEKAKTLLLFKEPPEFALGVSKNSIFGAGSAKGLQAGMLKGAAIATKNGLESVTHFEEIALLGEQIGPDRIGDMTCDVLKPDFIEYTQTIARRHGVPLTKVNVGTAGWDPRLKIWKPGNGIELPENPVASSYVGHPIGVLLTPKRFLRQMPSVDPDEFWDFAFSTDADQMRAEFNYELGQQVDRGTISKLARRHPKLLTAYLEGLAQTPKPAYDVDEDPNLLVKPADFGNLASLSLGAITAPSTEEEFNAFVEKLVVNFKHIVEQERGWASLWANGKPRAEKYAQILFQASAIQSCVDRDIDMSPESNPGRGPVDFKLSRGRRLRTLLELKLAKSSSFRRNLENQTPIYANAERCDQGYFIVVQFEPADFDSAFIKKAETLAAAVAAKNKMTFRIVWVDGRRPASASKA